MKETGACGNSDLFDSYPAGAGSGGEFVSTGPNSTSDIMPIVIDPSLNRHRKIHGNATGPGMGVQLETGVTG